MNFSREALYALDLLENTKKSLFITGRAGTGKSTLLKHFCVNTKKPYVILAPTGVAAINVGGQTIHSFFGFHPGITEKDIQRNAKARKDTTIYEKLEVLIIDEISMVRADLLDYIDIFLRLVRNSNEPFGGVQVVFFGDLYQLPPVLTDNEKNDFFFLYESPYFFSANVFKAIKNFEVIELTNIYRQKDSTFIEILNAIRNFTFNEDHLAILNERIIQEDIDFTNYVYLTTTNATVDKINLQKLSELEIEEFEFDGYVEGRFEDKLLPTDSTLKIKPGARVMFLNNDMENRWVNGSLGTVKKINLDKNIIFVNLDDGDEVEVSPHTWSNYESYFNKDTKNIERKEIGSFTQFPLRLAWAITIHKSQGKTFDKVFLDLGYGAFAHGQTYVALSRCTNLNGLILKREVRHQDIIIDKAIDNFMRRFYDNQLHEYNP